MARTNPMHLLNRLAAEHADARRLDIPVDELRGMRADALGRRSLLKYAAAAGVAVGAGGAVGLGGAAPAHAAAPWTRRSRAPPGSPSSGPGYPASPPPSPSRTPA